MSTPLEIAMRYLREARNHAERGDLDGMQLCCQLAADWAGRAHHEGGGGETRSEKIDRLAKEVARVEAREERRLRVVR